MIKNRFFWPVLVLLGLVALNIARNGLSFLTIHLTHGHLYGPIISIAIYAAPLILVSLGMTVVIATGGIDLSVGAVVAVAGALAALHISHEHDQNSVVGVLVAVAMALAISLVLGRWNGFLVSRVGIQPIVATLILMVSGRGVAQLITNGQTITLNSSTYKFIDGGFVLAVPFSVLIAVAVVALTVLLTRRTALGLLIESVGGNPVASRLVGINARRIKWMVYTFSGLCAGIAGLMISSQVTAADSNNAGMYIELDAILAVVIGGTSLMGGRFSLGGTVLGAVIIQTLTTTIYSIGVPTQSTMVFKAVVVIIVCLIQSPAFRAKVFRRRRTLGPPPGQPAAPVPAQPAAVEVQS